MSKKILLDTSFCIRLLKADDEYHQNAVDYFQYFSEEGYELYLSTIVVSEYSVKGDPNHLLALKAFKILPFDYKDAKTSGEFFRILLKTRKGWEQHRQVVVNDCKLIAQIHNRGIDAYVTRDKKSRNKIVGRIKAEVKLNVEFIDFSVPLKQYLGKLF